MYKVEKSKEDTREPCKLRSRNFSMTSEEFLWTKIIDITIAKSSFTVFNKQYQWQRLEQTEGKKKFNSILFLLRSFPNAMR